ncbi:vegetative incompatibility protein het-e-1 [Acrodontium crateriforme]|uniref:Vegetative incompatibility protein het-e-1 n=1 Tax=Acrodontium crateriforme TaxID=150365 RepID=A0AAQ3R886_9PEZI|nr:vegetative incompatibility protein het-e-1 [Acrodontium crateriforme]
MVPGSSVYAQPHSSSHFHSASSNYHLYTDMRLLRHNGAEKISFTEDLPKDRIPPYAILSHTWGLDRDEVHYEDVVNDDARSKPGYDKILFCMRQAQRDGFEHFWVDSCCINRTSTAELSEAINSMFRWYSNAGRCYVYLTDVPPRPVERTSEENCDNWERKFRASTWFTRGWTLQELLAPKSVEFFSKDGTRIGSRSSLERQIRDITRIPVRALRGSPYATFSIEERFSWQESRFTTLEEDRFYSLLGIMEVSMPAIYGEGAGNARRRLEKEVKDATKGTPSEDFTVTFSLTEVVEIEHFVSRHDALEEMKRTLTSDGSRRCIVLQGLGGIGKTQLSVAYAVQYRDNYSAVFWFNIKDDDSVKSSFIKVAKQILRDQPSAARLSGIDLNGDIDVVIDAVKAWLSLPNNTRWLLIFDNYDRPKLPGSKDSEAVDIRSYLPEAHQGFVIITTRSLEVRFGHTLSVKKLENLQDSLSILTTSSQRPELMQDLDARKLAQKLDGLPLALATAGAYLHQTPGVSCAEYLQYYETSWARLQEMSPRLMSYEDRMLFSTWQISYDQIAKRSPVSANLLRLWAYFGNQDIWFELLQHASTMDAPMWLRNLIADKLDFDGYVRLLCNHGLVDREIGDESGPESHGYSIHACVHSWTQTVLNKGWDQQLSSIAWRCIASHVPAPTSRQWWITSRRLLSHATSQTRVLEKAMILYDDVHGAFHNLGVLYGNQGKLDKAEEMYARALQGFEKALGLDDPSTLGTMSNLGVLYKNQGKLDKAEEMHARALQGYEKALGLDHPSTLGTMSNLGVLYSDQGKLDEAEEMYARALRGREKALGPDDPSTLDSMSNLGVLYQNQGKLDEAEEMFARALQGREKALGPDHPSTLDSMNNLGFPYSDQGKLDEAEEMFARALQGREKALGLDHPSTLDSMNNLGVLYRDQGKLDEAEEMFAQALQGREKALGPDDPSTLDTMSNLGVLYRDQGKLDEAEEMFARALQGREKALGLDDPSTLDTMNNLGVLYWNQKKLDEAEEMFQRALQGIEKAFGPAHERTLEITNNLGLFYADQGKLDEAEQMCQRALQGKEKALGPDDPSTLDTMNNLGFLYWDQGKLDEAEEMFQRALQGIEKAFGPAHERTLEITNNLGLFYADQGKLDEAEQMCQRALQGYRNLSYAPQSRLDTLEQSLSDVQRRRANTQRWAWSFPKPRYLPF